MKVAITLCVVLVLSVALRAGAEHGNDSREAFGRLKELAGTWNYTGDGRPSERPATYTLTGGDRVLVEDMGGMMSAYYLDGDRLVLTHFCGAGNQPRMRLTHVESGRISFEMFDITNLASPDSYHTTHLDVVFTGEDRVELRFRGTTAGRQSTSVFALTRPGQQRR